MYQQRAAAGKGAIATAATLIYALFDDGGVH